MTAYVPTTHAHEKAVALFETINQAHVAHFRYKLFLELWSVFATKVVNEPVESWASYVQNTENCLLFWAWVRDRHHGVWAKELRKEGLLG